MTNEELAKLIMKELGTNSYIKGLNYNNYITLVDENEFNDGSSIYYFYVKSESFRRFYSVNIKVKNNKLLSYNCTCPQFELNHTCKHIAACLFKYDEDIFKTPIDTFKITNDFLNSFSSNSFITNKIKEKINLELELDLENNTTFKLYVGSNKLYVINTESKFNDFIDAYKGEYPYRFGVNFTFDLSKHYFDEEDIWLLNFLYGYKKSYSYYYQRSNPFELNERETNILLEKIKDKKFKIKDYGTVYGVKFEAPTNLKLNLEDNVYNLYIEDYDNYKIINSDYKYILYNKYLYVIPISYSKILHALNMYDMNNFTFKKDKLETFKNGLLKEIKNNIDISNDINDIVISGKPDISLYFDLLKDKIECDIKLKYKDIIINYFDKNSSIIRDTATEENVIKDLISNNFVINNNKIELIDIDDIGYFLDFGLDTLKDKYEIYTSKKIDDMSILKKTNVKSNFSIGIDGIMSYNFDLENIDNSEVGSLLESLKTNKKYYKLKNGNIIDLDNDNLKEFSNLINDLDIKTRDLNNGNIEIPKYRAFYIDSLKNSKYKSINTSNSFNNFINNFKKYKNINISLNEQDNKLLRNYQKDGVKWLYTLYKCDLGGILADEMGLGKSIQTIYFIKEILKEKKDAKIMIVCPTALVYNWVSEFDKFGSELKYIAVAENKDKRKDIINHFENYNIFITSYGLIRNDNDEYEDKTFELCVIDEAQAIKNYQAGMTKEVKKIKARTKIALTGTPIENSIIELWSIFDFILPGYLNSIKKFNEKFGIKDVDTESLSTLTSLNYQIKPFILRRKKKDVTKELPDKIENNIYLELPNKQKQIYIEEVNKTKKEMDELIATEGFLKSRFKILQLLTKLRQICIDPNILYKNYKYDSIKMEKLLEIVKDYVIEGHKILIFSTFKTVIERVQNIFNKENISNYVIDGEVKSKERKELVDKFNNDDTNCFLITLKSGGVGLNLTGADVVIHLDIWWNPQAENQATDRAHRIGQKNKVTVIRLITKGTIEERILELQNKKKILSDNLIEGKDNSKIINSISEEEMHNLLSFGEDE